jgi:inosine-uridine nucleoside N-ribohydrolase
VNTRIGLIVDMDVGVDDALALLYLHAQPNAEIVAAGSVHGNAGAGQCAENMIKVFDLLGEDSVPVAVGAARPLRGLPHYASQVHGNDGLGDVISHGPRRGPSTESAPEQIIRLARESPGRLHLLATGPLTNVAIALLLEPRLPELIASVTLMGGSACGIGNITPVAEANIYHDPESADLVFGADWPVTMVGLDVTEATILDRAALARIAGANGPRARFAASILAHYLDFYESITGRRECPLHDPTAAAVAVHPNLVTRDAHAHVSVLCDDGPARGMTVVDRRGGESRKEQKDTAGAGRASGPQRESRTARVVTGIDAAAFIPAFLESITGER